MHILIIGCGYLGRRAASLWLQDDAHRVTALTRSASRAAELAKSGIRPIVGDLTDPSTIARLPEADVLLVAVTHDAASGVPRRALLVDGVAHLARAMRDRIRHLIYISSTSVYGQSDGSWVDESSPCEPASEGGRISLDAEQALENICRESGGRCRLTILRHAGIYGPGRLIARVEQLRSGTPVAGRPDAWLNLIHVDDAARCIVQTALGRHSSTTLLVCDDRPLTRREFYSEVTRLVGAPPPVFDPASTAGSRTSGLNKRCSNARLHAELQLALLHPDALAALPSVIAATFPDGRPST